MHCSFAVLRQLAVVAAVILFGAVSIGHCGTAPGDKMRQRYDSATRFAPWNVASLLRNAALKPHWSAMGETFWYKLDDSDGSKLVLRRASDGKILLQLPGRRLLAAIAAGTGLDPTWQAFESSRPEVTADGRSMEFSAGDRRGRCDLKRVVCAPVPGKRGTRPIDAVSPDGRRAVFVRDFNLWVRDLETGEESALTTDGIQHRAYAAASEEALGILTGSTSAADIQAAVIWSPDSRRLVSVRVDETAVPTFAVVEQVPRDQLLPKVHTIRYNFLAQGPQVHQELYVFDVFAHTRELIRVEDQPIAFDSTVFMRRVWWGPDGRGLAIGIFDPAEQWVDFYKVDPATGDAHKIFRESSSYRVYIASELQYPPPVALLANGDIVWYSMRDGFGHLYLLDGNTGNVRNAITSGTYTVHRLLFIDEHSGWIYFERGGDTYGPEPYFASVYRARLDGTRLTRLTAEEADHQVKTPFIGLGAPSPPTEQGFSPDGRHFIDQYSTPLEPEITVLRDAVGRVVAKLSKTDVLPAVSQCYHKPERIIVPAPSGREALHGTLHFPCDFDASRHYPVIDAIYNGSQIAETPRQFSETLFGTAQNLAELGFVVLVMDARGTPLRSRAFLEFAAEHPDQEASIGDHVFVLQQLAARRPYMDLTRVGVTGVSNGGYATLRAMLAYPDFFTVGVSANGSHDLRKYMIAGGMNQQAVAGSRGDGSFTARANQDLASRLRGKLLLILGGFDMNVPNASSLGVVEALFEAGKNFDMVVVPRMGHSISHDPFAVRKQWDYLVEHLLREDPPQDYVIAGPKVGVESE